jgi:hypothetical protein
MTTQRGVLCTALFTKYYSGDEIKKNEIGRACSTHGGERKGAYRALVGKRQERKPLKRPRRRWGENIKMDLREDGWIGMHWIGLAENDRWRTLVNEVMKLRVLE